MVDLDYQSMIFKEVLSPDFCQLQLYILFTYSLFINVVYKLRFDTWNIYRSSFLSTTKLGYIEIKKYVQLNIYLFSASLELVVRIWEVNIVRMVLDNFPVRSGRKYYIYY